MDWLLLVLSLPTQNATTRMRIWRSLKTHGAAVLRDGVYVLPYSDARESTLQAIAQEVIKDEGNAYVFKTQQLSDLDVKALFNRHKEYDALFAEIAQLRAELSEDKKDHALKQSRKLRKSVDHLLSIDFFPSKSKQQLIQTLHQLELSIARLGIPDEPAFRSGQTIQLNKADYQQRIWATRQRPWVDRLASAWLIRRFIDPEAHIIWLKDPADCPAHALGFDFDGAAFSHIENLVTFEVLLHSFALTDAALKRMASVIHFLDVGGPQPAEAAGIESVLQGFRAVILNDDQLFASASQVFDGLFANFQGE